MFLDLFGNLCSHNYDLGRQQISVLSTQHFVVWAALNLYRVNIGASVCSLVCFNRLIDIALSRSVR